MTLPTITGPITDIVNTINTAINEVNAELLVISAEATSAFVGDTGSGGTAGIVPAPAAGDAAAGKFLKASGAWDVPSGGGTPVINTQTASYTLVADDNTKTLELDMAVAGKLTVAPHASVAFPVGGYVNLISSGVGEVTVAPGAGVTIRARNGLALAGQYAAGSLQQLRQDEWLLSGDMTESSIVFGSGEITMDDFIVYGADVNSSLSYIGTLTDLTVTNSHTFTSASIGVASSDRVVACAINFTAMSENSSWALSSATIAGVAATIHTQHTGPDGYYSSGVAIISASVPSGTTGNIVLSFNGDVAVLCSVYAMTGLSSGIVYAASDHGFNTTKTISSTADAGDMLIAVTTTFGSSGTFSLTDTSANDLALTALVSGMNGQTRSNGGAGAGAGAVAASVSYSATIIVGMAQWR